MSQPAIVRTTSRITGRENDHLSECTNIDLDTMFIMDIEFLNQCHRAKRTLSLVFHQSTEEPEAFQKTNSNHLPLRRICSRMVQPSWEDYTTAIALRICIISTEAEAEAQVWKAAIKEEHNRNKKWTNTTYNNNRDFTRDLHRST